VRESQSAEMSVMKAKDILRRLASEYPESQAVVQLNDIERIAFHIQLVLEHKGRTATICDIGGGVGMFSVACAAMGMTSLLVDDFRDEINLKMGESALDLHKHYGVQVISKDVLREDINLPPASLDAITCFESMEHWHQSPKSLFKKLRTALKPNGLFVLSSPNCVDLKNRLLVPLGFGRWSSMDSWYESTVFRGHVREPDVNDLRYIGLDIGLKSMQIYGRNWWPYRFNPVPLRLAATGLDRVLRMRPALCSTIYLIGHV
jgi:2-polyprenyl-3-methyl-5-hydroxy-6-metoxy-1,4-benzoquinol methylase